MVYKGTGWGSWYDKMTAFLYMAIIKVLCN